MTPSSPSEYSGPSKPEPLSSSNGRIRLTPAFIERAEDEEVAEVPETPSPAPLLFGERKLRARIVKSRFGYYAHLTYGIARIGESGGGPFSFTRRGIERKIERTARRLKREDARRAAAEELII